MKLKPTLDGMVKQAKNYGLMSDPDVNPDIRSLQHLLLFGIKDIHLDPSLPAFFTPNVLDVLVKNYNLTPIGTSEGDLKKIPA